MTYNYQKTPFTVPGFMDYTKSTYSIKTINSIRNFSSDTIDRSVFNFNEQFLKSRSRYKDLPLEEYAVILHVHLQGYTTRIDLNKMIDFDLEWLKFIKENHNDILIEYRNTLKFKTVYAKLAILCLNFVTDFNKYKYEIDLSYSYLPFEETAIIRYASYTGYNALVDVEPKKIDKFNLEWLKFIKEKHNYILIEFRNTINYETVDAKLNPLCSNFMQDFFRKNK